MKRIKILIAVILLFTLTFSLTACGKPSDDNKDITAALNNTTVAQNQNVIVSSNTLETAMLSQPESTTTPVSGTSTTGTTASQAQSTAVSTNSDKGTTQKPTQTQQTNNPTNAPQQDNGVITAVNSYSADYNESLTQFFILRTLKKAT